MSLSRIVVALEQILLTLWIGGLWVSGLLFAPVLFASYERMLAGDIAGRLFMTMSFVGMACGVALLAATAWRAGRGAWRDWRVGVLALMLLITLIGEFGLAVRMREIKLLVTHLPDIETLWQEFRFLHGMSSSLYLAQCLFGLLLVVAGLRPRAQRGN